MLLNIGMRANPVRDSTGLAGDNLDLTAVLGIFKDSKNIEDFEKKLNASDIKVNNLDLNNDGKVDYLRIHDYGKDNFHSLVIQDLVSASETQDVAVIEVEKKNNGEAHVQIVGDEALYGKNYIIEPQEKKQAQQSQYVDDVYANPNEPVVFVNAWAWPSVQFLYGPQYVFWVSPWYWGYYPYWWYPWAPYPYWQYYHQNIMAYGYYNYGWRHSYVNHMPGPHVVYGPHRTYSPYVQKNNVQAGFSRNRYFPRQQIPRQQMQFQQKQNAPIMRESPALRYGPTQTGGIRGGGGRGFGGGGGFGGGRHR
jgi:hypothetical protein